MHWYTCKACGWKYGYIKDTLPTKPIPCPNPKCNAMIELSKESSKPAKKETAKKESEKKTSVKRGSQK